MEEAIMKSIVKILGFIVACAAANQSYDTFRSAFTGTQPKESAPDPNPQAISTRIAGIVWGLMSGASSLAIFWYALFS